MTSKCGRAGQLGLVISAVFGAGAFHPTNDFDVEIRLRRSGDIIEFTPILITRSPTRVRYVWEIERVGGTNAATTRARGTAETLHDQTEAVLTRTSMNLRPGERLLATLIVTRSDGQSLERTVDVGD
ncbi:MAG: curli-like amyloid fiber formation chaperone CsgH [Maricaulaceae bacterium]